MSTLATLPIALQLGLGLGYLCYLVAYAGERRGHSSQDATFLSLAFGVPALVPLSAGAGPLVANLLAGTFLAFGLAILWRGWGRSRWRRFIAWIGLTRDDGLLHCWDGILNRPDLRSSQISVHTADGRILCLNDRHRYAAAPFEGLYLGSDGGILMVVEEEELPDGTVETRTGISDTDWGTRLTYIPPDQIRRVNIRMT